MSYPSFFRKKVLKYRREERATIKDTAKHFKIGTASVIRWVHKVEPSKIRNKPPTKIEDKKLLADVEKYPDGYIRERAERLGVSRTGIGKALKRLKVSYKKNSTSSKSKRRGTYRIQG